MTIYIDPENGHDGNRGTRLTPVRTFDGALRLMDHCAAKIEYVELHKCPYTEECAGETNE